MNQPSVRNARADRAATQLHEEAEGRDNAPEEAIEAEGRTDYEDHDDDLDRGDDAARPCALKACTVAAAALPWLMVRGVLARHCASKACTVAAAMLRWLVGRSANQPSIRNARADRAVTRLPEEAEGGRENALKEAIEAEGHADHEDHNDDCVGPLA